MDTKYEASRPMGNVGSSQLATVISAWLVGLHKEIAPIIPCALEWIDGAIENGEDFGPDRNAYSTTLHWGKALGNWLEFANDCEGEWDSARVCEEARWRYQKRPWPNDEIVKYGLDDYMAFSFQGGDSDDGFAAGIDMYERYTGKKGLVSLSKILKPRELGYALCLHHTAHQQFDEDDLFKAGRKMLQANLQEVWLGNGQLIRAATWLKIVYWHPNRSLTPLQTVVKAYENMPRVAMPKFVSMS